MKTIYKEFHAGMENIYNSFFISFLALKVLEERPLTSDYIIPTSGLSYNRLEAAQLNSLQQDSVGEYVNSIRRHMLNDIVICYERYATRMYVSLKNDMTLTEPAMLDDRHIHSSCFERVPDLYTNEEKEFFEQLRRLRNSIVHFNGVYTKTNILDYTFYKNEYHSQGHEGESISIELDSIIFIYSRVLSIVESVNDRFFELKG